MYTHACTHMHTNACAHMHTYIHTYIHTHTHTHTYSGRMRTSSDGTPVIKVTATTGETLQLTPPYLSNVQGWQWVGDKMVINGEDGGTLTVELTILAPVGQDVSGTAFFDDICVTFEGKNTVCAVLQAAFDFGTLLLSRPFNGLCMGARR